ncbi:MAG: VCBS repeat-containing protein [Acidobacteria bacterium]|nr:VCBS repeat-containing protein [Acidobacteriota bacterium]
MKSSKVAIISGIICFIILSFTTLTARAARDTGFGSGGVATAVFPPVNSRSQKLAVLPDGKILTAGKTYGNTAYYGELVLAQFNADGSPDGAFGSGGKTVLPNFERVSDVYLLERTADGRFMVGGTFVNAANRTDAFIIRFQPNGIIDKSFADYGFLLIGNRTVADIEPLADGSFLVAGLSDPNQTSFWSGYVTRYTSAGQVDPTFAGGVFTTTFTDTIRVKFDSVKRLGPNRILATGTAGGLNGAAFVVMAMVDDNGLPVASFGNGGKVQSNFNIRNFALDPSALVVLPNGRIYVNYNGGWVAIYAANGILEQNKKIDGLESAASFVLTNDGRIVVAGYYPNVSNQLRIVAYSLYLKPLSALVPDIVWFDYAIQPDGKIIAAGQSNGASSTDLTAARYLSFEAIAPRRLDFNGDGRAEIGVCRQTPDRSLCYILFSGGGYRTVTGIWASQTILAEDYNGDGLTDLANWSVGTPSNLQQGSFSGLLTDPQGSNGYGFATEWGTAGDVPVGGDFDNDGVADFAVYRGGTWYVLRSSDHAMQAAGWGLPGDKPAAADYDGDGKTDFAVFRPSNGLWAISRSSDQAPYFALFGLAEDRPVPADYDGDGKADLAVFRPSTGVWYEMRSTEGFAAAAFGIASDRPVPADYDGDGKTDIAVFRPAAGDWYFLNSRDGFGVVHWGMAGDVPLTTAYSAY